MSRGVFATGIELSKLPIPHERSRTQSHQKLDPVMDVRVPMYPRARSPKNSLAIQGSDAFPTPLCFTVGNRTARERCPIAYSEAPSSHQPVPLCRR
eukprot:gene2122-biopygen1285